MLKGTTVVANAIPLFSPEANNDIARAARSEKVRSELARVALKNRGSMYALRHAVSSFTAELRDEGMSLEAVLILFKEAINQISLAPLLDTSTHGGSTLGGILTTWCTEDYFAHERLILRVATASPESAI